MGQREAEVGKRGSREAEKLKAQGLRLKGLEAESKVYRAWGKEKQKLGSGEGGRLRY